ncbi:MAG: hypothetical protein FWC11_04435 [Firmicutes bacterium]|nr:hypothetical protein [Bacillota bacterium]
MNITNSKKYIIVSFANFSFVVNFQSLLAPLLNNNNSFFNFIIALFEIIFTGFTHDINRVAVEMIHSALD